MLMRRTSDTPGSMQAARSTEARLPRRPSGRLVRAVTLDLWGTLFLDGPGSDERYKRQRLAGMQAGLAGAGIAVAPAQLERAYAATGRWLGSLWQVNRDVSVREHVVALLEAVDPALSDRVSDESMAALIRAYASPALVAPPAIDPGARVALETLAAEGVVLAVVSNTMRTPGEVVRQVLAQSELLPLFQVLTFSDECGIRKPAPAIFRRTLEALGVLPEDAVHVGDDPILDVEGARDAGLRVIQATPDGRATAPVKPDAVIRHLGELPAALGRLR
jgi:HAD superfamily hydrolase (TIGR01509 family)